MARLLYDCTTGLLPSFTLSATTASGLGLITAWPFKEADHAIPLPTPICRVSFPSGDERLYCWLFAEIPVTSITIRSFSFICIFLFLTINWTPLPDRSNSSFEIDFSFRAIPAERLTIFAYERF